MAKFEWSEVFMSIEGEAKWSGWPTVYIRFARCNFKCKGFNNPEKLDTTKIEVLGFNPKDYTDLKKIPLITRGCDSIYSWDSKFSHLWRIGDEHMLGQEVLNVLPHNSFCATSGQRVILSLTGGEPTLRAKFIPELLNAKEFEECKHILMETNCAVPLKWDFINSINEWLFNDPRRKWTWSNSPKLSVSGEKWEQAIRPEIAKTQRMVTGHCGYKPGYISSLQADTGNRWTPQVEQYFKFVVGPNASDFEEVLKAMNEYYDAGIPHDVEVYCMPVACTDEQQQEIDSDVAKMCMDYGMIYCHRLQNSVFGNGVGT